MHSGIVKITVSVALLGVLVTMAGCILFEPFMLREAPLPDGWPELMPVGKVRIQHYPEYREAIVTAGQEPQDQDRMFGRLFNHIKGADIAMTAPVDMGYSGEDPSAGMTSMAFLYRSTEQRSTGTDGEVQIPVEPVPQPTSAAAGP